MPDLRRWPCERAVGDAAGIHRSANGDGAAGAVVSRADVLSPRTPESRARHNTVYGPLSYTFFNLNRSTNLLIFSQITKRNPFQQQYRPWYLPDIHKKCISLRRGWISGSEIGKNRQKAVRISKQNALYGRFEGYPATESSRHLPKREMAGLIRIRFKAKAIPGRATALAM